MGIKTKLCLSKIFGNVLVAIRKSKITLTVNKSAYFRICILDPNKVLMYEFHYDHIKNKDVFILGR